MSLSIKYAIIMLVLFAAGNSFPAGCGYTFKNQKKPDLSDKYVNFISNKISKGDSKAIKCGVSMLKFTDAGYSESIKISLANALYANTIAVLSNMEDNLETLKWICGIPFIEPSSLFVDNYYKITRQHLINIIGKDDVYRHSALMCLHALDYVYIKSYAAH